MASGGKTMVINTLERAVSTDINRLEAFAAASNAEIARYMMDVAMGNDDVTPVGSGDVQVATLTTPMTGEIVGGLLVRPQTIASGNALALLVDPGVAYVINPDTDSDASNYKLVRDPGITNPATLVMTSNSSGSVRIDVVECQYSLTTAETDNRDIFNPATGAFVATTVTKANQAVFIYRVRAGTPGAGYPGAVSGWLPLAVVVVPTGVSACQNMAFYDVRPLLQDRVRGPYNLGSQNPTCNGLHANWLSIDPSQAGGKSYLTGFCETQAYDLFTASGVPGTRRLGGQIPNSFYDLNNALNQSGSIPANGAVYVYLIEPFGLPRWALYTESAGAIVPLGPRGIPVVSGVAPNSNGAPSGALALPPGAFAGTTTMGMCVAASVTLSNVVQGVISDGRTQWMGIAAGWNGSVAGTIVTPGTSTSASWTMTPGAVSGSSVLGYPASAKSIVVNIENLTLTSVGANTGTTPAPVVNLINIATGFTIASLQIPPTLAVNPTGSPTSEVISFQVEIPVPNNNVIGSGNWTLQVAVGLALSNAHARVVGWNL